MQTSIVAVGLLGWLTYCVLSAGAQTPDLGTSASLHGRRPFPADNAWNTPINQLSVDTNSDTLINSIGRNRPLHPDFGANDNGGPFGIPYVVVAGSTPRVPLSFDYADESDPGPYPIPPNASIEGGPTAQGDRHVLVIDRDHWKLYELYRRLSHRRRLESRLRRGPRPELGCPRVRRAGLRRMRRGCPSSPDWSATMKL